LSTPDAFLAQSLIPEVDIAGPVGEAFEATLSALEPALEAFGGVIETLVDLIATALTGPPAILVIAVLAAVAWGVKDWKLGLGTAAGFGLVAVSGFFEATMLGLALVLVATLLAIAVGVPLGILAARNDRVSSAVRPVLDLMQTLPSFVYLLLVVLAFGVGETAGVAASIIFAMPPAVRLTELGIRQVDTEVVEAAEAFGAESRQILRGVQLPLAMPTVMAGVNQTIMLTLSMVVVAGLAGAPGIGQEVVRAITRLQAGTGIVAGIAVVILAIYLDRVTSALESFGPAARAKTG
jgi:glycine betaine/proline transport system permease protein